MTAQLLETPPIVPIFTKIPRHVAVIMDGNGRWATQRNLPRIEGRSKGSPGSEEMVRLCDAWGIQALTVYAFSTENWKRPPEEVQFLMGLFERLIQRELEELCREDVRLRFIGDLSGLPTKLQAAINHAMEQTAQNQGVCLTVALNYGGRKEILKACQKLATEVQQGEIALEDIDEQRFSDALETHSLPDPDLLIRTSGEMRVSNFLLWQLAYTELYVTSTLWPDFDRHEFYQALLDYQNRDRRYGTLSSPNRR
ncbi:MAG: isoprenyl transferase [Acaryochloridaceae cyanobacterium RL_2_7]|nr:isoprenyl transferase [Acaryochloridaceae cyanobacterium RL_2_7]